MYARYITKSTHYEEYGMEVPDEFMNWTTKERIKYLKDHDMKDGEFKETVECTEREFTDEIEIEEG